MSIKLEGGCLCGKVRYTSEADPIMAAHCHCVDCRKSSGTGHGTHVVLPAAAVNVTGEVSNYDHAADSGNIVSRKFCSKCGCAIYSTNNAMEGMAFIRASSLDDPEAITPQMVVYSSRAPSWDYVDPSLPSFETVPDGGPAAVIAEHS